MPDVAIVGGGPVGVFLACLLAARNVDVEVYERRTEPSMRARAIGIHPPSLAALAEAGVADAVIAGAVRIVDGAVFCDGARLGGLSFEEVFPRYPFVAALPQYETEALLRARFDELRPGAFHSGCDVTGVRETGDGAEITMTGQAPVRARWVVGADGTRSVVRAAAGLVGRRRGAAGSYLMADFPDPADAEGGAASALLYFERGGVVESFPLPGGRRRWVAKTDRLLTDASTADLARIIRSRTGVELGESVDAPSPFVARQHLVERMAVGSVVLVGDAAHEISPIGGQGMNLGWLDALALAPVLEEAVRDPLGAEAALAAFDVRRRRAARVAAAQAGFNMWMGRSVSGVSLAVRNGLVRVLAGPLTRPLLARAFTMRWLQ
ncbi:FAD-dependent oxidoreductase [Cryobacterium tepidiphilum]|uniref:FAD-dependent monooxygenase n=1 Tax=Cryobacterium tepidiphilum TaxID=2486026 RepID=A0A3M8LF57_9MICO|nr:NAD(P)/FAD-dependent oxidoreductase [Cryobacterium tepidiphilum]RNE64116.1 FAD-dependent monooxygenase [Cryobacterium tepidiphilum]